MMQKLHNRGTNMAEWSAANLQFVWFVPDTADLKADELFVALVGSDPEAVQTSKVPRPNNPFLGVAEGGLEGLQHRLSIQPGRIDYFVQSGIEVEFGPSLIEKPDELLSRLAGSVGKIQVPSLRLACVLNLMKLEPSLTAANKTINDLIGMPVKFEDATDLSFQVNRPKNVAGIQINRLLRYSVGMFQFVQLALNPNFIQATPPTTQAFAANVIGDFNTVPGETIFHTGELEAIWGALVGEAKNFIEVRSLQVLF